MLSLILPTYNEADNILEMIPILRDTLSEIEYEIIIVDDNSPDGTWKVAQELSKDMDNVHVLRRVDRRGLSSAVIDGFLVAKGDVLSVMDADGQHDHTILPEIYSSVLDNKGVAIGSRSIEGGSVGEWDERRFLMSRIATKLAKKLCAVSVKDPMSGFFAVHRSVFEKALPKLNPKGFKILLDILVHVPKQTEAKEIPFTFSVRHHGESKLSWKVQIEFLEYLYDVTIGKIIPLVFVKYCLVGSLGVIVHVAAFTAISMAFKNGSDLTFSGFSFSVIGATETAILFNFWLNNIWTFSNSRLRGISIFTGLLKFNGACLFGALANYAVSAFLFSNGFPELASVIVGAFTGVIWNYTMNRMFTWKQ